ncbi:MAG: YggT family protein [Olegusella sp.]|nr:YggT family protein [Olegusella sp.]
MYRFAVFLSYIVNFYEILIVVWCALTWIPMRSGGMLEDVKAALGRIVEPYLSLFRRIIPPVGSMDFSPVVAMLALELILRVVVGILV